MRAPGVRAQANHVFAWNIHRSHLTPHSAKTATVWSGCAFQSSCQLHATVTSLLRSTQTCQDTLSHLSQPRTLAATHTPTAACAPQLWFLSQLSSTRAQDTPLTGAPPAMRWKAKTH